MHLPIWNMRHLRGQGMVITSGTEDLHSYRLCVFAFWCIKVDGVRWVG